MRLQPGLLGGRQRQRRGDKARDVGDIPACGNDLTGRVALQGVKRNAHRPRQHVFFTVDHKAIRRTEIRQNVIDG